MPGISNEAKRTSDKGGERMQEFTITVKETYETDCTVQAENEQEALRYVEERYLDGKIDCRYFGTWDITVKEVRA